MFYKGYLVKRSSHFPDVTNVVMLSESYIVTEPKYQERVGEKYTLCDGKGLIINDNKNAFIVFAFENVDGNDITKDDYKHIREAFCKMSKTELIRIYTMEAGARDMKSALPIFKNFNSMRESLNTFAEQVDLVSQFTTIKTKDETERDYQHIITKKSFSPSFYVLGQPYEIQFHAYPRAREVLRYKDTPNPSISVSDEFFTGILIEKSDDTIAFKIVQSATEDQPPHDANIRLSIEDVEKYRITIKAYQNEDNALIQQDAILSYFENIAIGRIGRPAEMLNFLRIKKEE